MQLRRWLVWLPSRPRWHATQIAGIFAVFVATGSTYVLGYVTGIRRPPSDAPAVPSATALIPTAP